MALFEAVAKANPHDLTDQLNLAMAYRMRAFFDIYYPTGGAEIQRALAVTDPLMQTHGDNLELKNERAEEYLVLGSVQDCIGERFQAQATFGQMLRLRQGILAAKVDYPQMATKGRPRRDDSGHADLAVRLSRTGHAAAQPRHCRLRSYGEINARTGCNARIGDLDQPPR